MWLPLSGISSTARPWAAVGARERLPFQVTHPYWGSQGALSMPILPCCSVDLLHPICCAPDTTDGTSGEYQRPADQIGPEPALCGPVRRWQ